MHGRRGVCVTYSRHWYCCDHLPVLIHYCTFICHLVCASLGSLPCMTEEADSLAEKDAGSSEGKTVPACMVGRCTVCRVYLSCMQYARLSRRMNSLSSQKFPKAPTAATPAGGRIKPKGNLCIGPRAAQSSETKDHTRYYVWPCLTNRNLPRFRSLLTCSNKNKNSPIELAS